MRHILFILFSLFSLSAFSQNWSIYGGGEYPVIAAENLTAGDAVCILQSGADIGKLAKADLFNDGSQAIGFCTKTTTTGDTAYYAIAGLVLNFPKAGLVPGRTYYLQETGGAVDTTITDSLLIQPLGRAVSDSVFQIDIGNRIDNRGFQLRDDETAPTALLMLAAGTASANTAPLKFTSGTNLTTVENGAVEYDGTDFFVSSGSTRYISPRTLRGSATLDFGSTAAGTSTDLTVTVTGASDGDVVSIGVPNGSTVSNGLFTAWVSATNTVTVRFSNNGLVTALDPASGTFKIVVFK